MDQRRPAQQLRSRPRDLLVVVAADQRLDRGERVVHRVPVHAQDLGPEQPTVILGRRDHEQALAEPPELDRQAPLRVRVVLRRQHERVPVAERPQQPHHARQDLEVRQARHLRGEPGHLGVEVGLRSLAERRVRPPLDLAGEEGQVGPPALVAGEAVRLDEAEQLPHGLVIEQRLPVLVVLRPVEVAQAQADRPAQLPQHAFAIAAADVTGGHLVRDLRGVDRFDLVPVQPDADLFRRAVGGQRAVVVAELEARLRQAHPVAADHGIELGHLGPSGRGGGPAGRAGLRLGVGQDAHVVAVIRHESSGGVTSSGVRWTVLRRRDRRGHRRHGEEPDLA